MPAPGASPDDASLRAGHRARLRAKFLKNGGAESDEEVLELLLGYVYLRRDNKIGARRLLKIFGSLSAVASAPPHALEAAGFGGSLAFFFRLLSDFHARAACGTACTRPSVGLNDVAALAVMRLSPLETEEVWAAMLDKQNRLLNFQCMSRGGVSSVSLEPLAVVERMISCHASAVVLVHNHPGGGVRPSEDDELLTERLGTTLGRLGLVLADHLVVSGERCFSLRLGSCIEVPAS